MAFKNYYKVLGVKDFAATPEIKKAYRALAFRYHPDQNKGGKSGPERFYEIKEAYEILLDPIKKRHFDASLRALHVHAPAYGFAKHGFQPPPQYSPPPVENDIPEKKQAVWISLAKPITFVIITAGLMFLIMRPPLWLARLWNQNQPKNEKARTP